MTIHLAAAHAAQVNAHASAIIHKGIHVTWQAFVERVSRRASFLHQLGIKKGARVAVLSTNVPEHLEMALSVAWAGFVLVPVNTRLSASEQSFILQHAGCDVLCYDISHTARANALLPASSAIQGVLMSPIDQWGQEHDPLQTLQPWPFTPADAQDTAAIFYTGGTTGMPKGVELSHTALSVQAMTAMNSYGLTHETVYMHTTPLFHLADFAAGLATTQAGGVHLFLPEFSAGAIIDAIEQHHVNVVVLVPSMIPIVLDAALERPGVIKRLRTILYGAAPIQEPLLQRLLHEAPGVGLIQVYGQTEASGGCTVLKPEFHVLEGANSGKLKSAGRPNPACLIKIVDEEGRTLPTGQSGEIWLSGPSIMKGYWQDPGMTAKTLRDGWLCTGDIGVLDADGFVSVVGRLKDLIITGGENVFAGETESALMFHPAVAMAAVIGVPDTRWGEAVHAVVVLKPGQTVSEQTLIEHCKTQIAGYKCPRSIAFRNTPLPLSGVGKVRKADLRLEWDTSQQGTTA